jgi:hypothetical protein
VIHHPPSHRPLQRRLGWRSIRRKKPIKSVKDFAFHILTVTIGILIALGLDALVEAHRHHELINHARADFRAEFTQNRAKLALQGTAEGTVKRELEGLIPYGKAKLVNQPATSPKIQSTRAFVLLPSTAWETAIATQAFLYLPFTETREISAAYSRQQVFKRNAGPRRGAMVRRGRARRPDRGGGRRPKACAGEDHHRLCLSDQPTGGADPAAAGLRSGAEIYARIARMRVD